MLARKGYAALTLADVAGVAGLSVGIVNFHFDTRTNAGRLPASSVDRILQQLKTALAAAEPNAARRLEAVLLADFKAELFNPRNTAAWIAFRGETQGAPSIMRSVPHSTPSTRK